jgi:hypothetical protein
LKACIRRFRKKLRSIVLAIKCSNLQNNSKILSKIDRISKKLERR